MNKQKTNEQIGVRVSIVTLLGNVALSTLKLFAGVFGHSAAMISDAVHSLSDVMSPLIVIIGIKVSAKPADNKHRFGHDRFESIASIILAFMLFVTGAGIGYSGITKVLEGTTGTIAVPGLVALIAAIDLTTQRKRFMMRLKGKKNRYAIARSPWFPY